MHEWALAEGVVLTIEKEAKEKRFNGVEKIVIGLGELQQIDQEILKFAIEELAQAQDRLFENVDIVFNEQKALIKCRKCGHQWGLSDTKRKLTAVEAEAVHFVPEVSHVYMRCPQCKSPDFEILQGRGLWVDSIVGRTED